MDRVSIPRIRSVVLKEGGAKIFFLDIADSVKTLTNQNQIRYVSNHAPLTVLAERSGIQT